MAKLCVEDPSHGKWHARSRCFECWVALVQREARSSKSARKPDRRVMLFTEARRARQDGEEARRRYILKHRALPEEQLAHGRRHGTMTLRGMSIERTFVSDIELDNGTGDWSGYDYFGDVSRDNWPELERYGLGGRDVSRKQKA